MYRSVGATIGWSVAIEGNKLLDVAVVHVVWSVVVQMKMTRPTQFGVELYD